MPLPKLVRVVGAGALFLFLIPLGLWALGSKLDPLLFASQWLDPVRLLGVPMLMAGAAISIASILQLNRLGSGMPWGDVAADDQSSKLATGGLYRYSRNPMLFGFGLFVMGIGICTASVTMAFLLSTFVVALVSIWIRRLEEQKLAERFGAEYHDYRKRTSFLIPLPQKKRS
jgi:protein-S-isoprenylcysteine O-methyltransferase Ste14